MSQALTLDLPGVATGYEHPHLIRLRAGGGR